MTNKIGVILKKIRVGRMIPHGKSDLQIYRKSVEKIQVSLKSDKNTGYFTLRLMYIYNNIYLNYS
jgi:hypothetical protein